MDMLSEELLQFWQMLNKHNVRYILVGGFATRFHGFNRSTDDVDLWLDDNVDNRKNLRKAFAELEYGDYESLETMQFVPGWTNFHIGSGIVLDVMTDMKGIGLSFNECYGKSPRAEIEGIEVPFLHINQLIDNKKTVNRPKDQIDVEQLEKIREIRQNLNK